MGTVASGRFGSALSAALDSFCNMSPIFEKAGYITVTHNAVGDYVLFDWTNFMVTLDEIKTLHEKALTTARRHNCRNYVADTVKVTTTLRPEVVAWWGSTWVPVLAEYGLRAIVTVIPTSAVATLSTSNWQRQVISGITMLNVRSLRQAEEVLAKV
jgi:hypothetical protein